MSLNKKVMLLIVSALIIIAIFAISYIYMNPKNENQGAVPNTTKTVDTIYYLNQEVVSEAQFMAFKKTLNISATMSGEIEHTSGDRQPFWDATDSKGTRYVYSSRDLEGKTYYSISLK